MTDAEKEDFEEDEEVEESEEQEQDDDTSEENGETEDDSTEENVENQETKPKQSQEKNEYYKNLRLQKKEEERIRAEERKKLILEEAKGVNPYTNKPIVDEEDEEEFLTMREIEKTGKDPVSDYSDYIKEQKREEKRNAQALTPANDVQNFVKENPNVNVKELLENKDFTDMFEDQIGKVPLTTLYKAYEKTQEKIVESKKQAIKSNRKKSTVGSVSSSSTPPTKNYSEMDIRSKDFDDLLKKALRGDLSKR